MYQISINLSSPSIPCSNLAKFAFYSVLLVLYFRGHPIFIQYILCSRVHDCFKIAISKPIIFIIILLLSLLFLFILFYFFEGEGRVRDFFFVHQNLGLIFDRAYFQEELLSENYQFLGTSSL